MGRVVSLIILFVLITGCGEDEPLKIVKEYNEAVINAYRTGDTTNLKNVAGDKEAWIITVLIDTKRNEGLVLESTLEELKVEEAKRTGKDEMIIDTFERWSYYDRPLQPGKKAGPPIKSEMKVRYECRKEEGRWKVMKVKVKENKYLAGKE